MLTSSCIVNSGASQTYVWLLAAVYSSQYDAVVLLSPQAPKAVRCFPLGLSSRYSAASSQTLLFSLLTFQKQQSLLLCVLPCFYFRAELIFVFFLFLLISGLRESCESMIWAFKNVFCFKKKKKKKLTCNEQSFLFRTELMNSHWNGHVGH